MPRGGRKVYTAFVLWAILDDHQEVVSKIVEAIVSLQGFDARAAARALHRTSIWLSMKS